ncbi:MAG: phospholipid/cholesterol/gamma-HCH transport system substrate-binding protein [Nocardioidaceae bacterium]|jgi:phospholipid/cholesterol/gamma-HCH transport system substrate-binding protein|nr:phospholipid/cholesterol/gamma-HCH transport system substrate-binding protein [Nocardioidaceae bacterium]
MLVNIHHDSKREHARLLVAGVVFLTCIALLIAFSIAVYQKRFERVTMVEIHADRAGLQLAKFGDVRIHGVLVGQVRSVSENGKEAVIKVALDPAAADEIPANVSVQIIPTTLFGQKFISFVRPDNPSKEGLHDGQVIPSDRVETNVELSKILADLFPLLRAVEPAQLNYTLNALATALEGRGEQLGQTLDELDAYLGAISDKLPTLRQDLISLANVADIYDLAAPDLIDVLGNLTVTSKTIIDKAADLDVFFSDLQGLAVTSTRVLSDNERNLIRVGRVTEPVLKLLAIYSPEFPCLLEGAAKYAPVLAKSFGGNQVKQFLEFGTAQYEPYHADDRPVYGEVGHGPWCSGLPNPDIPIGPVAFKDGTDIDSNPPTSSAPTQGRLAQRGLGDANASGYAGTEAEKSIVNALLAGETGRAADTYGALGSLLYGPVVRGGDAS